MSFEGTLQSSRSGRHRLTPRIVFQIELKNSTNQQLYANVVTGEISIYDKDIGVGFATLNPLLLGKFMLPHSGNSISMTLDLNFREIAIIEELRKGDDVFFEILLTLLFESPKERRDNSGQLTFSHQFYVNIAGNARARKLKIPQSEWVKMLDDMGYGRLRIIELPIPEPPKGTKIEKSVEFVEDALKKFNEGNYRDTLTDCRRAIERLEDADIDLVTLLESKSKSDEIVQIQKKIKVFLSSGVHPKDTHYINRSDAELALYFTTSLIRYLAKQLK